MLRSSRKMTARTTAALIHSLLLGTAAVTTTVAVSTLMVGCKDENQPEYWIEKLDDSKWRPNAVKRLTQFLDDALAAANNNMQAPQVQALLNKVVDPLTKVYVEDYAEFDTGTRTSLIKLLADFRDKRTEPALKKAFDEFAKRPRTTSDETDIKWAVRAYADLKLMSLAPSVFAAFEKLEAHTMLGGVTYRDYSEAMVKAPSPTWTGALIQKLGEPMNDPSTAKTKEAAKDMIDPFRDQQFWQLTAAQVLGELKEPTAVDPLMKVLLDPGKSSIATTALLGLVKIGKPSVDAAAKILDGSDTKNIEFYKANLAKSGSKEETSKNPALPIAAAVIGMAGRQDGIAPMVKVLEGDAPAADKAIVARELAKIPATPESKAAFKKAFETIPADTSLQGSNALTMLAEAAAQFYDPSMVPWMIERAAAVKGADEDAKGIQQSLVNSALKLAKADQWDGVAKAAEKYDAKDLAAAYAAPLKACGDKVDCYLTTIQSTAAQAGDGKQGIKAGYMIGVLGDAGARDKLVDGLPSIENAAVRFVAAQTIDFLTPKGSNEVVTRLDQIIAKNKKSADQDKIAGDAPLQQVSYRISARGG